MVAEKWFVTGPSGAGKTYLCSELNARGITRAVDLDFYGYRYPSEDWSTWHIPTWVYDACADSDEINVIAGVSSDDEQIDFAKRAGLRVILLVPTFVELSANLATRDSDGDRMKLDMAEDELSHWYALARTNDLTIAETVEDALDMIAK